VQLVMVGDYNIGKSSYLLRFYEDSFSSSYFTTIGIDFKLVSIKLDGQPIKLQIWDTPNRGTK
jgi:small GTP-binding protein